MMKFSLLTVLAHLLFISCSKEPSKEEKVKTVIETYLMKSLHDPKSYEFVEMSKIDTIYKKVYYKKMYDSYNLIYLKSKKSQEKNVPEFKKLIKSFQNFGAKKYASDIREAENEIIKINANVMQNQINRDKFLELLSNSKENEILEPLVSDKKSLDNRDFFRIVELLFH